MAAASVTRLFTLTAGFRHGTFRNIKIRMKQFLTCYIISRPKSNIFCITMEFYEIPYTTPVITGKLFTIDSPSISQMINEPVHRRRWLLPIGYIICCIKRTRVIIYWWKWRRGRS